MDNPNHKADGTFAEGHNASKKARLVGDILRRAVVQEDAKRLRKAMDKVLDLAVEGERWACEYIRDTLDGKPVQAVEGTGDNGEFTLKLIERVIIDNVTDKNA